jgi:hypothetical protein
MLSTGRTPAVPELAGISVGVSETRKSRSDETPPLNVRLSTVLFPQIVMGIAKVPFGPTGEWLIRHGDEIHPGTYSSFLQRRALPALSFRRTH